ncbi:solute carrier family 22 member 14 [Moschus berezovskii]|uniref:solute carrier family 22 member 14 n=1 Tax=Moschus berezovskii TaxID=68408 RepID=UPI002443870D|nr:solute carrier family 22 member 14 [Moschus berezovskii]
MAKENSLKIEFKSHPHPRNLHQHDGAESPHSCSLDMLLQRLRAIDAQEDKLANIMDVVGEFGTFQRRLVALNFIPNFLSSFFMFADTFVFTPQKPYCNTSWIVAADSNLTEAEQMNLTLPRAPNGSFLTCLMYVPVEWDLNSIIQFGLNHTDSCQNGWIYPEIKTRSLINEFDLVCGKEPNKEIVHTMFLAGLLTGAFLFGFITDKLGRYPTILLSLLELIIFGFGTAFVSSFNQYIFFRFCVSQAVVGYTISSSALITEWLMGMHRAHAFILGHCFFGMGVIFLTGLAYSLPHWRLLFLVGGTPIFPLICYIWILPESPRWLIMKGKLEEAKQMLCYAAGVNKKTIPLSLLDKLQLPGKKVASVSILDFYSNKYLRKLTLVMCSVWFAVGCNYYMLGLKIKELGVNIHLSQVIPGMMEVPARLCCIFLIEQLKRRQTLIVTLFQGAIMCFLSLMLPSGKSGHRLRWLLCLATGLKSLVVLITLLGEFSLAASITMFYIYTSELLPTVIRATGLGLMSLAWAAGGISSLMLVSQNVAFLLIILCCLSAFVALFYCSSMPETQDQPLPDSLEHITPHTRSISEELSSEDMLSDDMTEEVAKNTILNARLTSIDQDGLSSTSLQPKEETLDKEED